MKKRDCANCKHHSEDGCSSWDCEFEPKDLISRADAIAYIDRIINSGLGRNKSLDYIHKYISSLPLADAVQGEWTYLSGSKGSYMTISCPICGSTFNDVAEWTYNFCPNCGARNERR